ncbi:MAG: adenylyl-sulfate kinase, partial [Alphaproteobacteria bacterium]
MKKPQNTFLLALGGLSGSGKTATAHQVAQALHARDGTDIAVIEPDPIRKELLGVSPTTRLGDDAYIWEITKQVIAEMEQRTAALLAAGTSVIWTSTFAQEYQRQEKQDYAAAHGAQFAGFWLDAPQGVLLERVSLRELEGNDASDANADILLRQIERQQPVTDWPKINAAKPL